jgi:hypothetical protein
MWYSTDIWPSAYCNWAERYTMSHTRTAQYHFCLFSCQHCQHSLPAKRRYNWHISFRRNYTSKHHAWHSTSTGSLVVHDKLTRCGGNDRVFEIHFTSIIRFRRSALFHAFRDKKRGRVLLRPCSICHRVEWEPEKNASQSSWTQVQELKMLTSWW